MLYLDGQFSVIQITKISGYYLQILFDNEDLSTENIFELI